MGQEQGVFTVKNVRGNMKKQRRFYKNCNDWIGHRHHTSVRCMDCQHEFNSNPKKAKELEIVNRDLLWEKLKKK